MPNLSCGYGVRRWLAKKQWDFESLVGDYARVQLLLGKLTLAGLGHTIHLAAGFEAAQQARPQFESFLTTASLARPALSHAGL